MVQVLFRSCNVSLVERVELHNSVSIVEWTHTEEKLRFCGFLTIFSRNLSENWIFECNLFCKNGIQLKINSMHAHCSHFFVDLSFILWINFSKQSNLDPILWNQKKKFANCDFSPVTSENKLIFQVLAFLVLVCVYKICCSH